MLSKRFDITIELPIFLVYVLYFDLRFFTFDMSKGQNRAAVKHVLSKHPTIDKTKTFMTNGRLMKVESIADCSPWSILQYL